jgi:hypothetical protein
VGAPACGLDGGAGGGWEGGGREGGCTLHLTNTLGGVEVIDLYSCRCKS